jgi:GNAT superfamily N-acetyltransferase
MNAEIRIAESDAEIDACFPVMSQLRPKLQRAEFVPLVRRMGKHGFALAYVRAGGEVQAVAGYRLTEMLRTGMMLEIDDLISAEASRSKGYGKLLLDWCCELAARHGCSVVELDSAVQRADAHRFYFREKMFVLGFHFSRAVSQP